MCFTIRKKNFKKVFTFANILLMMNYEGSENARENFGIFIYQPLVRKLERILIKWYRHHVSLLFNKTNFNEGLLPVNTHTHTHTHTHTYIYIYKKASFIKENETVCLFFLTVFFMSSCYISCVWTLNQSNVVYKFIYLFSECLKIFTLAIQPVYYPVALLTTFPKIAL